MHSTRQFDYGAAFCMRVLTSISNDPHSHRMEITADLGTSIALSKKRLLHDPCSTDRSPYSQRSPALQFPLKWTSPMQRHPLSQDARERLQREREPQASNASVAIATDQLDLASINALAGRSSGLTATIYLPTHRSGPDRQQDHVRVKNLLHAAQRMLDGAANGGPAVAMLGPVTKATQDPGFWAHPGDGLALFCGVDGFQHFWLPVAMPELVVVSERCHLKPLIPLLQGDGRFYLLDLTQHGVRLYTGTRFGLQPIELPGAPASVEEALGPTDIERHTGERLINAAGQGSSRKFGTVGDERAKERIQEYFQRIDSCVCALLHGEHAPLVIAGVEYLLPLYAEMNHYPHLMAAGIPGNPHSSQTAILHERAWEVVAPHFAKAADEAGERYARLHGSGRTTGDMKTVLSAVTQGRVDELFVASDRERWGRYDVLHDEVREHEPRWPDDEDLLNLALITALAIRSRVLVLPLAQMPDQQEIAAILRF